MGDPATANNSNRVIISRSTGPTSVTYGDHRGLGTFGLPTSVVQWWGAFFDVWRTSLRA